MKLITKRELLQVGAPSVKRDAAQTPELADCAHRRATQSITYVRCDLLERITGNSVSVCRHTCAACRSGGGFSVTENQQLAKIAMAVIGSRYFPDCDRKKLAREAPGEREAAVRVVQAVHGNDAALRFVNSLVAARVFEAAEDAVGLLEKLELI